MVESIQLEGLAALDDPTRREKTRALVAAVRETTAARVRAEPWDTVFLSDLSDFYDGLIRGLAGELPITGVSIVALGGYGRRELFPFSDIDLLILHQGARVEQIDALIERLVYPLWDAGVTLGHAVRDIEETLDLAETDLTMQTALLDARCIWGDEGPFFALSAGAQRAFFGPQQVNAFVGKLSDERKRRHRRFGESVYLLEPNVKSNKGGLRDVNIALWAAKARFGVEDFAELEAHDAATPRQLKALTDARDFICRLRCAMHVAAGRAQDQLLFGLQEELAPQIFPDQAMPTRRREPRRVAGVRQDVEIAVERLMHAFYRHARNVVLESAGLLDRVCLSSVPEQMPSPQREMIGEHYVVSERVLSIVDPQKFWDDPVEILRAFVVARDNELRFDRITVDAMAEALADHPGAQLPADAQAAELFLDLLTTPSQGGLLQRMHNVGLVAAIIPELEPCTGRVQHDIYHVYTVDQHTIYVVELLRNLRCGKFDPRLEPIAKSVAKLDEQTLRRLYLAALLHDVAKPLGSGHARKGARLARGVAARLGLGSAAQEDVAFLVREHLTMAHTSQRRDLSDPEVVTSFAKLVTTPQRLAALLALTAADTAMTRPDNLNAWKLSLLVELAERTESAWQSEPAPAEADLVAVRRRRVSEVLAARLPERERLLARLPERMLRSTASDQQLAEDLAAVASYESDGQVQIRLHSEQQSDVAQLTVCCADRPRLLATIAGALAAEGIEVLSAEIYTFAEREGERPDTILDRFTVVADHQSKRGIADVEQTLRAALADESALERLLARRIGGASPLRANRVLPPVPTSVRFDMEASRQYLVIEVSAADRRGLLYDLTSTLSDLELEIHRAMIATESNRAHDIFYVLDRSTGTKVFDPQRLSQIESRLFGLIDADRRGA
ncbi:MAG: [protein-PII] uridylyltransferase [Deltaproteobacteria bacterium]|nr:[protein-PII] uridylyltransferase [Deltaproteobacteria bacterium]